MSYSLEIEGLVAYKHKLEAEIERLQRMWAEVCKDYGELRARNEFLDKTLRDAIAAQDFNGARKALEGK